MLATIRDELVSMDVDANRFRFFVIEVRAATGGGAELHRRWGRVGTGGRHKVEPYLSLAAAETAHRALLEHRSRRGYVVADSAMMKGVRRQLAAHRLARRKPRQVAFPIALGF